MSKEIQCKCCKEYWWEDNINKTNRLCPNCYDYVADLEAKLAESEKKILELQEDSIRDNQIYNEQLAEKEKENKKLKEVVDCVDKLKQFNVDMKDYALVNKDVADEIYCEHQTKTDFAIEQLEKLKHNIWTDQQDDGWLDESVDIYFLTETIDQQIKELKEGK